MEPKGIIKRKKEKIEHEFLKREGENLHYDLYISYPEAALGVSKDIEAVNGKVRIKLEEGIQSGKILRLKGKGIPSLNSYGNGDLLVHINVWTPKVLNKEQKNRTLAIQTYMQENDINEVDIDGISFSRTLKTSVSINLQNLSEIIEDPSELEAFKVLHSTTKERLKITRPKKRSRNE